MKIQLLVVLLLFSFNCLAQLNLVPNPSFEIYDTCPYNDGQIYFASPWFQPFTNNSSTDYFNTCATSSSFDVPSNAVGYQLAATGSAYTGFTPAAGINNNSREYLEVQLTDTLKAGKKYCVSFYVSFAENSQKAIDAIGAYFSNTPTVDTIGWYVMLYQPQVENPSGNVITDSINWTLIQDDFIANGGEKYLTIGNFRWGANTTIVPNPNGTYNFSYYYIDDISVLYCDSSVGVNENNLPNNIIVYPNPARDEITIENLKHSQVVCIKEMSGKTVLILKVSNNVELINLSNLAAGMYSIQINDQKELIYQSKLAIIK